MLFWLLILGTFMYFVVKRNLSGITRTPTWLLWLVMMTPVLVLIAWIQLYGKDKPMPLVLLIGLFAICPLVYWLLIQWGRTPPTRSADTSNSIAKGQPKGYKATQGGLKSDESASKKVVRPIDNAEEATLKNCFPWGIFYLQDIEYRPQAMICRGRLRTSPDVAYQTIRDNIQSQFGDRFLVIFQEGLSGKPFFALVPNPQAQVVNQRTQMPITRPGLAIGLLLMTLLTTTTFGGEWITGVTDVDLPEKISFLEAGLPYALALMAILGCHEMGHYLTARFYGIQTTLPYFIPVPFFLGTFGAFIQLRSPVPNRKALFDVGIAGPMLGLVVTLPLLIWGLAQSEVVPLPETASMLQFEAFTPSSSLLIALLSKFALGNKLTLESAINLHPVAVAGCLGLVVTALNLMPVGQLDGGHIVHAMFGQRTAAAIGQIARILVLVLSVVQQELFIWAILLFFIPIVDEPALNDVSELNNQRDFWGLIALSLLVIIILPAPRAIMQVLF
ncbi:MAG: site-2 protease family protein [Cyanothece sp. SIO1E1]|nr:site-2 protease family protein [Cyanothece sp. SIO1E1]